MPVDEVFEEFNDLVDMSPTEMDAWGDSDNRENYAEEKSAGQPIDEPLEDVMRLKETRKSDWKDADDWNSAMAMAAVLFVVLPLGAIIVYLKGMQRGR